jgi:hypothetical protein
MALFNVDPRAIGEQIGTTAAARAAQAVAQSMSPKLVRDVQRVLKIGNIVGNTLGLRTGIGVLDNLFSLGGIEDTPSALLGGLTLKQVKVMHDQMKAARVAKKNLFFIRVMDQKPPTGSYQSGGANNVANSLSGLISSRIGPAVGTISSGISSAVNSIAGPSAGKFASELTGGALIALGLGGANSIGAIAANSFDLLAMDVSYGPSLISDHVQVGSGFIDRPTGRNPTELSITTMDDEAGSLKRWFNGKMDQVALPDGTFGLPADYLVTIEIVHAIPSAEVPGYELAYSKTMRMRAQTLQVDLSRREQAVAELSMTWTQFDNWMI